MIRALLLAILLLVAVIPACGDSVDNSVALEEPLRFKYAINSTEQPAQFFPGDMPAANAGIVAGDTITSVNGKSVTTAAGLSADIHAYAVGSSVTIAWLDTSGVSHSASVTLVAGPAS